MCIPPPPTTTKARITTAASPCTPPSSVSRSPFVFFFLDLQKSLLSFVSCTSSDILLPVADDDSSVNSINETKEETVLNEHIRERMNPEDQPSGLSSSASSLSSSSTDIEISIVVVTAFDERGILKSTDEQVATSFEIENDDRRGVVVMPFYEYGDSKSTDDEEDDTNNFQIENDHHHGVVVMSFDECGKLKFAEDTNSLQTDTSNHRAESLSPVVVDITPNTNVATTTTTTRKQNEEAGLQKEKQQQAAQEDNDNKSDSSSGIYSSEQRTLILPMSDLTGSTNGTMNKHTQKQKIKQKKKIKSRLLRICSRKLKSSSSTKLETISGSDSDFTQSMDSVSLSDDKNSDTNSVIKLRPPSILRKNILDDTSALSQPENQCSVRFAHGTVFEHPGQTTRRKVRRLPNRGRASRMRKQQRVKDALEKMQLDHDVQPNQEPTMIVMSIEDPGLICNNFQEMEPFVDAASTMNCYVFR